MWLLTHTAAEYFICQQLSDRTCRLLDGLEADMNPAGVVPQVSSAPPAAGGSTCWSKTIKEPGAEEEEEEEEEVEV